MSLYISIGHASGEVATVLISIILHFKQNIPFLYQHSTCSQVGNCTQPTVRASPSDPNILFCMSKGTSPGSPTSAQKKMVQHPHSSRCRLGLFLFYLIATQANKNVTLASRRDCFHLFVEL